MKNYFFILFQIYLFILFSNGQKILKNLTIKNQNNGNKIEFKENNTIINFKDDFEIESFFISNRNSFDVI